MDETERAFFDACVHEGMESDGYAIAAALRGFRRWRGSGKPVERKRADMRQIFANGDATHRYPL